MKFKYKRMVIKVGSNVLTQADGLPDVARIRHLVEQLAYIKSQGIEVILVSSGAVASGRSLISITDQKNPVALRQVLSSLGQVKLINTYSQFFQDHQLLCAQVLVTKEDFRDRLHYLNMKNCFESLLHHQIVPIVNENDVISVTELMFTDNDELAGLIASMLRADALVILSNIDGIYDGDPKLPGSRIIEEVRQQEYNFSQIIRPEKSTFGRGGMITKASIALKIAKLGIAVHIANGKADQVLPRLLYQGLAHTCFVPEKKKSGKKNWIAHAENAATGSVQLNEGAKAVLSTGKVSSLLPVGIVQVKGDFQKGDIIKILDPEEQTIGWGIARYSADKTRERMGQKRQPALIHYDYLYAI